MAPEKYEARCGATGHRLPWLRDHSSEEWVLSDYKGEQYRGDKRARSGESKHRRDDYIAAL